MKIDSGRQRGADILGKSMARDRDEEALLAGAIDCANLLGSLPAGDAWKIDIHQDAVIRYGTAFLDGLLAAGRSVSLQAMMRKPAHKNFSIHCNVIDNKNFSLAA